MAFPVDWLIKQQVDLHPELVTSGVDIDNYPVLLTEDSLDSSIFTNAISTGADIRFSTDSAGANLVPRDIESFDPSAETCRIHVKIPVLSETASEKVLYAWWGKAGESAPADDADTWKIETVDTLDNAVAALRSKQRYPKRYTDLEPFVDLTTRAWTSAPVGLTIVGGRVQADSTALAGKNAELRISNDVDFHDMGLNGTDFDISIDYDLDTFGGTGDIQCRWNPTTQSWADSISYFMKWNGTNAYIQIKGHGAGTWIYLNNLSSDYQSGSMRLKRVSGDVYAFYWNDSASQWEWDGDTSGLLIKESDTEVYFSRTAFVMSTATGDSVIYSDNWYASTATVTLSTNWRLTEVYNLTNPSTFAVGQATEFQGTTSAIVTLSPAGANTNGAKWSVDQETWYDSGDDVDLGLGIFTVYYKQTSNYATPVSGSLTLTVDDYTDIESGTYTILSDTCNITINLSAFAVGIGAKWSLDAGNSWQDSDAILAVISGVNHAVLYKHISRYINNEEQIIYNTVTGGNYSESGEYESELWPSEYKHRLKATVLASNVNEDVTDFPLRLHLSDSSGLSNLDVTELFTELDNYDRKKMMVWNATAGCRCYAEQVFFTEEDDLASIYIKTDLFASNDTEIFLYFDKTAPENKDYIGDIADEVSRKVWVGYYAVYHYYQTKERSGQWEGQTETILDSSEDRRHSTYQTNVSDYPDGDNVFIREGIPFISMANGTSQTFHYIPGMTGMTDLDDFAIECMYQPDTNETMRLFSGTQGALLTHDTKLTCWAVDENDGSPTNSFDGFADFAVLNADNYAAMRIEKTTFDLEAVGNDTSFVNATHNAAGSWVAPGDYTVAGCGSSTQEMHGDFGALRLHKTSRSLAWFQASSLMMRDLLITYTTIEHEEEGTVKVTILPADAVTDGATWTMDSGRTNNASGAIINHKGGTYNVTPLALSASKWGHLNDIEITVTDSTLTEITVTYTLASVNITTMGITGLAGDEIMQRNRSTNDADIPVIGSGISIGTSATLVEGRFVHADTLVPATSWATLANTSNVNTTVLGVPEGGMYRLETRGTHGGVLKDPSLSHKQIGVGLLIGMIGQSNIGTWVEPGLEVRPSKHTRKFRHRADNFDPTWEYAGWQEFGEIRGAAFGNYLYELTELPIAILQYARGASSLLGDATGYYWLDNGTAVYDSYEGLYTKFIEGVAAVGGDIEMIAWYQGEAEATDEDPPNASGYATGLATFFGRLDSDIRANVPIIYHTLARLWGSASPIPELSFSYIPDSNDTDYAAIREVQRDYIYGPGVGHMVEVQNVDVEMNVKSSGIFDSVNGIHISYKGTAISAIRSAYAAAYLLGYDIDVVGPSITSCRSIDSTHTEVLITSENPLANSYPEDLYGFDILDDASSVLVSSAIQDINNPHLVTVTHAAVNGALTVRYELKDGVSTNPDRLAVPRDTTPAQFPIVSMLSGVSISPLTDYKTNFATHSKHMQSRKT